MVRVMLTTSDTAAAFAYAGEMLTAQSNGAERRRGVVDRARHARAQRLCRSKGSYGEEEEAIGAVKGSVPNKSARGVMVDRSGNHLERRPREIWNAIEWAGNL
jgi:hypothetical protein